ncbi:NfeD family protein [Hyphococcus sp.]|uniref:NfeD family protein n=1 Tax=Hyphococcus sp. TaxID=2038636 RepID=UPI002087750A|nr:MAG: hypothetical protein DHS20C04_05050 [Marinicaulis sp.]
MIDFVGLPDHPVRFFAIAIFAGFALVAIVKLYGLFFMRWKTPFRVGDAMNVNHAEVVEWSDDKGYVSAGGELWRASSKEALQPGDAVTIVSVEGLSLKVKKLPA